MKKNLVRIVAAMLVALLALTLIPLGALAVTVDVHRDYFEQSSPSPAHPAVGGEYVGQKGSSSATSVTIKTSDYDRYLVYNGKGYDLKGILNPEKLPSSPTSPYSLVSSYTFKQDIAAWLFYTPHNHKLSCWISDGTTHWRNCLVCDEPFMYQNWCQDGDEDGSCNICGGHVPYHDVTVIESEGGKITVNRDTASHRMKITADVEPAAGYKLEKLHFVKIREDGSRQEITRRVKNGQFYTSMPTYELEVSAEFTKN